MSQGHPTSGRIAPQQGRITSLLVVERNDAQAALLSDRQRFTLFREPSPLAGLHYRTEGLTLILKGDELTLDQPPSRITCLRTEEV
ncbi:MAG: hypothetical protein ACKOPN_00265 [Prochlorococcaceae cyanobacterium]